MERRGARASRRRRQEIRGHREWMAEGRRRPRETPAGQRREVACNRRRAGSYRSGPSCFRRASGRLPLRPVSLDPQAREETDARHGLRRHGQRRRRPLRLRAARRARRRHRARARSRVRAAERAAPGKLRRPHLGTRRPRPRDRSARRCGNDQARHGLAARRRPGQHPRLAPLRDEVDGRARTRRPLRWRSSARASPSTPAAFR